MSGKKCSSVSYSSEVNVKRNALSAARSAAQDVSGTRSTMESILRAADPIVLAKLGDLVANADAWRQRSSSLTTQGLEISTALSTLTAQRDAITAAASEGGALVQQIREGIHAAEESVRQHLLSDMATMEAQESAYHARLATQGVKIDVLGPVARIQEYLDAGRFTEAHKVCAQTRAVLQPAIDEIDRLERTKAESAQRAKLTEAGTRMAILRSSIFRARSGVPDALSSRFERDLKRADSALAAIESSLRVGVGESLEELQSATQQRLMVLKTAEDAAEALSANVIPEIQRLTDLAQSHASSFSDSLAKDADAIGKWAGAQVLSDLRSAEQEGNRLIKSMDYAAAAKWFEEAQQKLRGLSDEVANLNQLNDTRTYVVESLTRVLTDYGFKVSKPEQERADDPKSVVLLRVDTKGAGDMTFRIALDGMESDSCISERFCLKDFDAMSERLEEEFGVKTQFRPPEGSAPLRKHAGERDEDFGSSISEEA